MTLKTSNVDTNEEEKYTFLYLIAYENTLTHTLTQNAHTYGNQTQSYYYFIGITTIIPLNAFLGCLIFCILFCPRSSRSVDCV